MDTLTFLRRVLPDEGVYFGGLVNSNGAWSQSGRTSLEDLRDFVQVVSEKGCDAYFAISSFKDKTSRKVANLLKCKTFALDIDVGKENNSYPSRKEALVALGAFVDEAGLPKPLIVSSGMGFHVYWVLTEAIDYDTWHPSASALKQLAITKGLIVDPVVTADAARVLRPINTIHTKTGRAVSVLIDAPPVAFQDFQRVVGSFIPPHVARRKTTLINNLQTQRAPLPPTNPRAVEAHCKQIRWAIDHPDEVSEPFWYAMLGVASCTTDPEATAKEWSKGYSEYNEQRTLEKLEQWKANASGPSLCQSFQNYRSSGCDKCVFRGKISSPAALGVVHEEVAPAPDAPQVAQVIELPARYKRTATGIKLKAQDTDIDVCPFDIYPVGYGKDETLGYETVRYAWNRQHVGWTPLSFRQALLTDGHRDFASTIADQGIVLASRQQTELFQMLLRTYMDKLRAEKALSNLYATMGWKEHAEQFVIGDVVIKRDVQGTVIEEESTLSAGTTRTSTDLYSLNGTLQAWIDGTEVLQQADMPGHMFALGMGWAAPLFAFTGLKGLTVSLYGPTGGGKTLAQYWIQSIYGNPDRLHFAAKFTQNTFFSRLAMYSNLPMTVDEATVFQDKDVGDFLYWVSQGRDKARLNRMAEERDAKTWAAPVIVSTNVSLQSKLVSSGIDTDAQMARLLEVSIQPHQLFKSSSNAGQKIYSHLITNYGYAGRKYISELVRIGEAGLVQMIEDARKNFVSKYGVSFAGEERYWEQAIILQDLGSEIAQRLGLIKYDYTLGTKWVLNQIGSMRHSIRDNKQDAFDILGEYLNDNASAAVTVMHTGGTALADSSKMPREDIRARFDVYRKSASAPFEQGTVMVDRAHFRKWLASKGHDYKTFVSEIVREGLDKTPSSKRAYMGRDTSTKLPPTYVIGISLNHPRLAGMLNVGEESIERIVANRLQVIDGGP